MCTGGESHQGPLGPKSDALYTAPLRPHHPLLADISFKFLSLILFEIWHLQNFISIFSKDHNFTRGDIKKNIYASASHFYEESIHEVSR